MKRTLNTTINRLKNEKNDGHITRLDNTISDVEYAWGKDISGTRHGAAGIGGLLYLKRDGVIYVPCYDAYGNILGYYDAQGNVVASYTYDAFGNIVSEPCGDSPRRVPRASYNASAGVPPVPRIH